MLVEDVAKLSPDDRLLYWVRERHQIYLRRRAGKPPPWSDDEVLNSYFFTNPYRENDKVTVWFRENIRGPLAESDAVLMATVIFRWFNWPPTGQLLIDNCLLTDWRQDEAEALLAAEAEAGNQVFTGAYMISGKHFTGRPKTETVCRLITPVWQERHRLVKEIKAHRSLQQCCELLQHFRGLGGFMSYEVACDLRHTALLRDATDVMTWCNPGPGAKRGLNRILGRPLKAAIPPEVWHRETQRLLALFNRRLPKMPKCEMREVEHSLCEWDKMERARMGEGHLKRRYDPYAAGS